MNVKEQIKIHGYQKAAQDIFIRLLGRTIGGYIFCCLTLPTDVKTAPVFSSNSHKYSFGFIEPEQLVKLIKPDEMTMTHAFADQAYAKGDRCFCIMDDAKLIHYSWYSTSPTHLTHGLEFHFPNDKVYMYNAFTDIAYRGQKLYPAAVSQAVKFYIDHGCSGAVTIIAENNYSSISAVEHIGFHKIGKFYVIYLGKHYVYPSTGCRNHGVSLVRSR